MRYQHTFHLSACHFNSQKAYDTLWKYTDDYNQRLVPPDIMFMLSDIHGHNFKIEITVEGIFDPGDHWLVDDMALEKLVMEWSGINLSLHKDFLLTKRRATTENMAEALSRKLHIFFAEDQMFTGHWKVRVWETNDIFAEVRGRQDGPRLSR